MRFHMITAEYCSACRTLYPEIKALAAELGIPLVITDVENDPQGVAKLQIESLPTLILEQGDEELQRVVGAFKKKRLHQLFSPHLPEPHTLTTTGRPFPCSTCAT